MRLSHRQKDLALTYGVLITFAVLIAIACIGLSGCGTWGGIDVKVRPGGQSDKVQPTPPPPPKDDWAPPWFRRPKSNMGQVDLHFVSFQPDEPEVGDPESTTPIVDEPEEHPAGDNDEEKGRLLRRCVNCGCQAGSEEQPKHHHQRPGILWEVVSVAWKYFTLPLTIVEGVQQIAFFGGITLFTYLFARLFIARR